jgi:phosphopantetheinyl transferase (holo-ACP synthase)
VYLSEKAKQRALARGGNSVRVSLSHSKENAIALAVCVFEI